MNNLSDAMNIYDMMAKGKMTDAFEKYYHENVTIVEANGEARKGKDANLRKY
jgi:hypothetical protein